MQLGASKMNICFRDYIKRAVRPALRTEKLYNAEMKANSKCNLSTYIM